MKSLLVICQSSRFAGALAAASVGVLICAVLMQHFMNLSPCPLCILQRYCLIGLTALCVIASTSRRMEKGALALAGLTALGGVALAIRQEYLQSVPSIGTGCGPGFEYIVNSFPLTEMLPLLFKGTGDCSQVDWIWHGVTLPKMSLAAFAGFATLIAARLTFRRQKP